MYSLVEYVDYIARSSGILEIINAAYFLPLLIRLIEYRISQNVSVYEAQAGALQVTCTCSNVVACFMYLNHQK